MSEELSTLGQQPEEDTEMQLSYPSTQGAQNDGTDVGSGSDEEDDDDDEEDDGEDEAEEIARRLTAQLWADIKKARAAATVPQRQPEAIAQGPAQVSQNIASDTRAPSKDIAAISTIKTVLLFAATDPLVHSTLATTVVPGFEGTNVLDMLQNIVKVGTVSKEIAAPLSQVVVSLARSELLFSPLPAIPSSAQIQKRKRDEDDNQTSRPSKRTAHDERDIQTQLGGAIHVIAQALNTNPTESALNPSVIASIQQQLHQVFLFAVTSSTVGGQNMTILQEISGLIQVLGVLSGIQIVQPSMTHETDAKRPPHSQHTDIETAVYPCLISGCNKTFSRLYNLRTHQRVHASHRPFKCSTCPASFARNHDLKRHERGHEHVAYKCLGCMKVFSRRDAIKRHKSSVTAKARREDELASITSGEHIQGELPCVDAAIEEVELEGEDKSLHTAKEGRRARLWNGIANSGGHVGNDVLEEGELPRNVLESAQAAVTSLHGLLQRHVVKALGGDVSTVQSGSGDQFMDTAPRQEAQVGAAEATTDADASLASLIARITDIATGERTTITRPNPTDFPSSDVAPTNTDVQSHSLDDQTSSTVMNTPSSSAQTFSRYGLNADQTFLLEQAIANATAAAQAQAEAEALLEEGEEDDEGDDEGDDAEEGGEDGEVGGGDAGGS